MGWVTPAQVTASVDAIVAGSIAGGTPAYVCRGYYPSIRTPGNAYPGYTTTAPTVGGSGGTCNIVVFGTSVSASIFEYLVSSRGGAPPPSGASPAAAPPSPSASPIAAGTAVWITGTTTAITNGLVAGAEGSATIFVCMGVASLLGATSTISMAGKYEVANGACNVPYNGREVVARSSYQVLQSSPWLVWASAFFVPGTMPVMFSIGDGNMAGICRAWHPTARTGPHAGTLMYTTSGNVCQFSYGGAVVSVSNPSGYDTLFLAQSTSNVTQVQAAASVVPQPSVSPSPSVTPSTSASSSGAPPGVAMWLPAATVLASGASAMQAGYERVMSNTVSVCRSTLVTGDVVPGRWEAQRGTCDIPFSAAVAGTDLLVRSPYLIWTSDASTIPSAIPVNAGLYQGMNATVCRAYNPTAYGSFTGPEAGVLLPGSAVCVFNMSGTVTTSSPYQILVVVQTIPSNASSSMPAYPSPSTSPTPSPTASASLAPIVPGTIQWLPSTPFAIPSGLVQTGMDGASPVYVCRGSISDGYPDYMPGKWIPYWGFCDVPMRNTEVNDPVFDVLRVNPWHTWVPINGTAPAGAVMVDGGIFMGSLAYVCRAIHTQSGSGPHAGFTDWQMYGPYRICVFSYGGKVTRTHIFDYLVMAPPASPTVTPSVPGTPSMPASATPSSSNSISTTASMIPSASVGASASSTSSIRISASSTSSGSVTSRASASSSAAVASSSASKSPAAVLAASPSPSGTTSRSPLPPVVAAATGAAPSGPNTTGLAVGLSVAIAVVVLGGAYWVYKGRKGRTAGALRLGADRPAASTSRRPRAEPEAVTAANDAFKDDLAAMTAGAGGVRTAPAREPGARSANV